MAEKKTNKLRITTTKLKNMGGLSEFYEKFPDEIACEKFLFEQKFPGGFKCPKCHAEKYYWVNYQVHSVKCAACKATFSLTRNTLFEQSKQTLLSWFQTIFLMSNTPMGNSSYSVGKNVLCTDMTSWLMQQKIRNTMKEDRDQYRLGGQDRSVMLDGVHWGKKEPSTFLIAVEIEKNSGKVHRAFGQQVSSEDAINIEDFSRSYIKNETLIISDGHSAYPPAIKKMPQIDLCNVSHRAEEFSHNHLKPLNQIVGNFKSWMACIHKHCRSENLNLYLNEFCYRFNRRYQAGKFFWNLLSRCAIRPRNIFYRQLVGTKKNAEQSIPVLTAA